MKLDELIIVFIKENKLDNNNEKIDFFSLSIMK